ncbi:Shikimate / quinate 5-dehydrogenase [Prochlorococcus marinus subsp. pastoris str. CCMP1986]|uniref:Shikimate dehydrogenase (NADP(+)) n=1 Tax=Prochlorococcus marinus subsp. pastoris (strain CCMP1986 / NIES-2087 / MED4) TaxID=59919 RepID=AROE_PROMP|nr:shikimate dehydrogenase [Prochlorococcus marinus]Q7UZG2.1 RecName: Full=Shikimate dehydrogenase (NADP(+)); Short=SDH [Prochlorococcus marinus subsp. pastoris str. CCMP1986]KGF86952.1 Shikimate 5-dehydrogenase I alpha [Prochlorococcus marinus str. EQPAC1]CAE20164.1 Shikimate / quinate 5-dehydrogenase [Prochlorococcus marinus subsp. pastoris str. CCMP1986]
MITSKTSFLALIGNPVSHSLSPIMQNAAIQYLGLDLIYMAIPCKNEDLEIVVNSIKKMNCKGLNITIPFKQKVFDMCSEISPVAKKVKAINTLKLNDNKNWIGTNTDIDGFIYPLKNLNLIKKSSLILGSGGAARSVIQGLIELKLSKITIISRKRNSLNELITNFKNDIEIKGLLSTNNEIKNLIQETDLIINTTPVGMSNTTNTDELPFGQGFWDSINSKTIVYDLIYNPSPTPFLKFCDKKGCMTIDGTQMLIAQGAKSLSFWTNGLEVPYEVMHDALKEYL